MSILILKFRNPWVRSAAENIHEHSKVFAFAGAIGLLLMGCMSMPTWLHGCHMPSSFGQVAWKLAAATGGLAAISLISYGILNWKKQVEAKPISNFDSEL